jgi:phytoene dehydrogenase-like protein
MEYDAIIVGGGHNGLTCGAYLARAGLRTLVLERRAVLGGAAVTEEFSRGFRASTFSFIMGHLHPKVVAELQLERHGLTRIAVDNVIHPLYDDECIVFTKDPAKNREQIARFSRKDADAYPRFFEALSGSVNLLRRLQLETPIDPTRRDLRSLLKTARFLWRFRDAGRDFYRIIDTLALSADDFISQWFECDAVKAHFLYWATIGGNVGPRAPGTAFYLVAHLIGQTGLSFARGGMGAISESIASSGRASGLQTRTSADVTTIITEQGRATGVRLASGEELRARLVVSNLNAKVTFGHLVPPSSLPDEFLQDIRGFRARGTSFKVLCAVDRLPQYRGFDEQRTGVSYPAYAHIAPTTDYLQRAYDEAEAGAFSSNPFLSPIVPTFYDDTLAPPGKHVVTLYGGVAPYALKGTDWDAQRGALLQTSLRVMDRFAPGFSASVLDAQVLVPPDMERILNMPGGNTQHGDLTLDQMFFMRPAPGYADYRSPIRGLYQCGASTHPGGSVSAVSGHNAAREILLDWPRLRR